LTDILIRTAPGTKSDADYAMSGPWEVRRALGKFGTMWVVISVSVRRHLGGDQRAVAKAIVREILENLVHVPLEDSADERCISRFAVARTATSACVNALEATLSFYGFRVQMPSNERCDGD